MFERFDFTDDGQYFRVLVVKVGRVRIASYSNRLGLSVWLARHSVRTARAKENEKKFSPALANQRQASYTF